MLIDWLMIGLGAAGVVLTGVFAFYTALWETKDRRPAAVLLVCIAFLCGNLVGNGIQGITYRSLQKQMDALAVVAEDIIWKPEPPYTFRQALENSTVKMTQYYGPEKSEYEILIADGYLMTLMDLGTGFEPVQLNTVDNGIFYTFTRNPNTDEGEDIWYLDWIYETTSSDVVEEFIRSTGIASDEEISAGLTSYIPVQGENFLTLSAKLQWERKNRFRTETVFMLQDYTGLVSVVRLMDVSIGNTQIVIPEGLAEVLGDKENQAEELRDILSGTYVSAEPAEILQIDEIGPAVSELP